MNEFQIGAMPVSGGFIAWIRKVHKAENEPIKGKGGNPIIYRTRAEAKAAAGEAIVAYINGRLTRDGARLEARSVADSYFPGIVKQKGREKRIVVERRAARA